MEMRIHVSLEVTDLKQSFWARDPDGHDWEFWVRNSDTDTRDGIPVAAQATAKPQCCAPRKC